MSLDLEKHRREIARWRLLFAINAGRPYEVSEQILLLALNDIKLTLTINELRRELDYLEERDLIRIDGKDDNLWSAELTRTGIDVIEYTVPCEPGIARPPKHARH